MIPLDLVNLTRLMELTSGRSDVAVGLIDGPVAMNHPDLSHGNVREVPGGIAGACTQATSHACMHGTFVAGVLCANRSSVAPAICPDCTLLVRPIFAETASGNGQMPGSTPEVLAEAIIETIEAGARVVNLSLALDPSSSKGHRELKQALDFAASRGAILVAAAGNQGAIGGTTLIQHSCVIPVVAYSLQGVLSSLSNLGSSIGRRGLGAPGQDITSLGTNGNPRTSGGTSAAAPFVTGTIALLHSVFPSATMAQVKLAVTQVSAQRRTTVVPPLLNAWAAYQNLKFTQKRS